MLDDDVVEDAWDTQYVWLQWHQQQKGKVGEKKNKKKKKKKKKKMMIMLIVCKIFMPLENSQEVHILWDEDTWRLTHDTHVYASNCISLNKARKNSHTFDQILY